MDCKNELHVIEGGDHSFKIGKKFLESLGMTQDQAEKAAVKAVADFVLKSIKEIDCIYFSWKQPNLCRSAV